MSVEVIVDDCLLHILSFLPKSDLLKSACFVSYQWLDVSFSNVLWRDYNYWQEKSLSFIFSFVRMFGSHLTSLNIRRSVVLTDPVFHSMLHHIYSLEELVLCDASSITIMLSSSSANQQNTNEELASHSSSSNSSALDQLYDSNGQLTIPTEPIPLPDRIFSNLRVLSLDRCVIKVQSLSRILSLCQNTLEELVLSRTGFKISLLFTLQRKKSKGDLYLPQKSSRKQSFGGSVLMSFPQLKKLTLGQYNKAISSKEMNDLVETIFPNLESLTLSQYPISDKMLCENAHRWKSLKSLNIINPNVSSSGVFSFNKFVSVARELEELKLGYNHSHQTDFESLRMFVSSCKKLSKIDILISDDFLVRSYLFHGPVYYTYSPDRDHNGHECICNILLDAPETLRSLSYMSWRNAYTSNINYDEESRYLKMLQSKTMPFKLHYLALNQQYCSSNFIKGLLALECCSQLKVLDIRAFDKTLVRELCKLYGHSLEKLITSSRSYNRSLMQQIANVGLEVSL